MSPGAVPQRYWEKAGELEVESFCICWNSVIPGRPRAETIQLLPNHTMQLGVSVQTPPVPSASQARPLTQQHPAPVKRLYVYKGTFLRD